MSKNILLGGVSAAAFTLMIGSAAMAAQIVVPAVPSAPTPVATANGHVTDATVAGNTGNVTATITGGAVSTTVGSGTQVVTSTTGNTAAASATGDSAATSVTVAPTPPAALPLAGSGGAPATDGIAALNLLVDSGIITSAVNATSFNQVLASTSGAATNSSNTISATTTLNTATATVSGEVPSSADYTPAATDEGAATFRYQDGEIDTLTQTGVLAVANGQLSEGAGPLGGSYAQLNSDSAYVTILPVAGSTVTTTVNQNTNALTATYEGNSAVNAVAINSGDNPTFNGSASLSNSQANLDTGATLTPRAAYNNSSSVYTTIAGATGNATFDGTLNENGNTISASATGNTAQGADGATGNTLTLANGENLTPVRQSQSNSVTWNATNGLNATSAGALDLLNVQVNDTVAGDTSTLNATTNLGTVLATVQNTGAGTPITVDSNVISAAGTGNSGSNAIAAGGSSSTEITGPVTLTSAQHNDHTSVTSVVSISGVAGQVGTGAGGLIGDGTVVAVSDNTIDATTFANSVSNTLGLSANTVDGATNTGSATVLRTDNSGEAAFGASNGVTLLNGQGVYANGAAPVVQSTVSDSSVSLVAGASAGLTSDTFTVDGNVLNSTAVANSGTSGLSLSGSQTVDNTTDVVNGQTSHAPVTASLTGSQVLLSLMQTAAAAGDVTSSPLDLSSNTLQARAWGNSATSSLDVSGVTTLNLATNGGGVNTAITLDTADAANLPFDDTATASVNADHGLLSDQALDGSVTATNSNISDVSQVYLLVGSGAGATSDLVGGSAKADSNHVTSAARGNVASNTLTLGSTTSADETINAGGAYSTAAGISNIQSVQGGVATTATTSTTNALVSADTVQVTIAGSVTDAALVDASSNTISALALANTGTNDLSVNGNSIVDAGTDALGGASTSDTALSTRAAFAVSNAQSSAAGSSVLADATNDGVQVRVGGDVTDSVLTVTANTLSATATDNGASNSLTLAAASTLQSSASLLNYQLSAADPTAEQGLNNRTNGTPPSAGTPPTFTPTAGGPYVDPDATFLDVPGAGGTPGHYTFDGWSLIGPPTYNGTAWTWTYNLQTDPGTPPSPGTPAAPGTGASVVLAGNIDPSTITVTGNKGLATSTANNAVNTLTASSGATAEDGLGTPTTIGAVSNVGVTTVQTASGTFSAANIQAMTATSDVTATNYLDTSVNGVNPTASTQVTDSTVSVSTNTADATAEGNLAANTVKISATSSSTVPITSQAVTGSLLSAQTSVSDTGVGALSGDIVAGPGQLTTSHLIMDGNTNTALARTNDAVNALTATASANLDSGYGGFGTAEATVPFFGSSFGFTAGADFALNNIQYVATGPTSAEAEMSVFQSDLSLTGGVTSSTASLSGNHNTAESDVNLGASTLTVGAGTALSASAALLNDQSSLDTSLAGTESSVSFTEPSITAASAVTLNGNISGATANGNSATNGIVATGSSITGLADTFAPGASSTLGFLSDYVATASNALTNVQSLASGADVSAENSLTATINAPSTLTPSEVTISDSTASVSSNQASAYAQGNLATSTIRLTAGDSISTSASVESLQLTPSDGGIFGPAIGASSTADISGPGLLDTSTLNLNSNTNVALAVANHATNILNVGASTSLGTVSTATDATAGSDTAFFGFDNGASADFSVANAQQYGIFFPAGPVTASATTRVTQSGNATTGNVLNSTASLSSNTARSEADANVASNTVGLGGTNGVSASGALSNFQIGFAEVSNAQSALTVGYTEPQASGSTITVGSNLLTALATVNSATNGLTVTGDDISNTGSQSTVNTASVDTTTETVSAQADFALSNSQLANAVDGVSAGGTLAVTVNNGLAGGALLNSTVSLTANTGTVESDGNVASNTLALNAGASLQSSAALTSNQLNDADSTATMSGTVQYTWSNATAGSAYTIQNATITTSNNTSQALASGNTATNALNATTSDLYSNPIAGASSTTSATGPTSQSVAQYAALNSQTNEASVSASNTTNIGSVLNSTGATTGVSVTNSAISANNNLVLAQAYGNNAATSITLSPAIGGMPSAALTSAQSNTNSVTSTVTSSVISIGAPVNATASTLIVSGNVMSANATGNAATSHVGVGH